MNSKNIQTKSNSAFEISKKKKEKKKEPKKNKAKA